MLRRALVDRLNRGLLLGCRLTLASAPAGYGKTSLIAEWVRQLDRPIAWVSLEASENDAVRFWRYVAAALQTAAPDAKLDLPWPAAHGDVDDLAGLVDTLLTQLAACPPLVLVLDDFQFIDAGAVLSSFNFFLDHLPDHVHIALTTRTDPPVLLWRRRARQQVQEVRTEDLSLSLDQTGEFLRDVMRVDLSPDQTRALHRQSEGWVTGLQLAALSLTGCPDPDGFIASFAGANRDVSEYLVNEVLSHQPAEVERFLLQTSILQRLTPSLCDAVTGRTDSDEMLPRLERANLFVVAVDAERRWFRYHALFAAQLQRHYLRCAPQDAEEGHRRASGWCEAEGFASEAVEHALAGRDYTRAIMLLDRNYAALISQGRGIHLETWLNQLPAEITASRLRIGLAYVAAAMYRGDLPEVRERLAVVERLLETETGQDPAATADYSCQITIVRTWLALFRDFDPAGGLRYGRQAVAQSQELAPSAQASALHCLAHALHGAGDSGGASRAFSDALALAQAGKSIKTEAAVTCFWAAHLIELGQLTRARELCLQQVARHQEKRTALLAPIYYALALVDYERNDLDSAAEKVRVANAVDLPMYYGTVALLLFDMRIRLAQDSELALGEPERALDYISFRSAMAPGPQAIDLWLRLGRVDAARTAARSWGLADTRSSVLTLAERLAWARILVARGEAEEALRLLDEVEPLVTGSALDGHLQLKIQQALAHQACGDDAQALRAIERALALAQPEGYCRSFLDAGLPMAALLRRAAQGSEGERAVQRKGRTDSARYAAQLLQAVPLLPPLARPLTGREREVLALLAQGLSYVEMSEKLVVSLNTVRTHVKSIYRKLDARTADEAVERARGYHLLDPSSTPSALRS